MDDYSAFNFLSSSVFKKLGIDNPTPEQKRFIMALVSHIGMTHLKMSFEKNLSEQEVACLFWTAKGKTTHEIAKILGIKYSTIRSYCIRIKEKLDCRTMAQAVFEAIRYGQIKPKFDDYDI
jgi:DNA-binding CsgD family transcriptional regulator